MELNFFHIYQNENRMKLNFFQYISETNMTRSLLICNILMTIRNQYEYLRVNRLLFA